MCQSDNNAYFGLSAESLSFGPSVAIPVYQLKVSVGPGVAINRYQSW